MVLSQSFDVILERDISYNGGKNVFKNTTGTVRFLKIMRKIK